MAYKIFLLTLLGMLASANAMDPSNVAQLNRRRRGLNIRNFDFIEEVLQKKSNKPSIPAGFQVKTYAQTLDHFNYGPQSSQTFPQRYAINSKHWGGASTNSPIFLYTGDEAALEGDLAAGLIIENAQRFKAFLVFVEHRYYGKSHPFGSTEEAFRNSSTLQHFSSEQALADYAQFLRDLKKDLSAENCPVIAVGGSYGGMLAAWFRLKYPHMVIGALASSAPILYFDDLTPHDAYDLVAMNDYKEINEHCYETIKSSWSEIDKVAHQVNGLATLSQVFNTCSPLSNTDDLKNFLETLYTKCAQYDAPKTNPVKKVCAGIDGEAQNNSVLQKIVSGIISLRGNSKCLNITTSTLAEDRLSGWNWQTCTELVIPIGTLRKKTMFEASPFNITNFSLSCAELYVGAPMRPHWITTEFGGQNIKKVLEKFGSNIIFSNGLRDPYSSGGVQQSISNSIMAIVTKKGSHCLDILGSDPSDPEWLISQRKIEIEILEKWIAEYNAK